MKAKIFGKVLAQTIYAVHLYKELMSQWDPNCRLLQWQMPTFPLLDDVDTARASVKYWILWLIDTVVGDWIEAIPGNIAHIDPAERSKIIEYAIEADRQRIKNNRLVETTCILEEILGIIHLVHAIEEKTSDYENFMDLLNRMWFSSMGEKYPEGDLWEGALVSMAFTHLKYRYIKEMQRYSSEKFCGLFPEDVARNVTSEVNNFLNDTVGQLVNLLPAELRKSAPNTVDLAMQVGESTDSQLADFITAEKINLAVQAVVLAYLVKFYSALPTDMVGALNERIGVMISRLELH